MTRLAIRLAAIVAFVTGCASPEPDWAPGHAADPEAPVGAETPVARVLREDPPAPPAAEAGAHHRHHQARDEAPADAPTSEDDHAH